MKFDERKPRIFLKHPVSSKLIGKLNRYLNSKVKKQRTHKYGHSSKLKTVMLDDTEQLVRYIRGELSFWKPTVL